MTESAFDVTRRGYDRDQVDDRVRALSERLAAAEEARRQESERAHQLEAQLASRVSSSPRGQGRSASPAPASTSTSTSLSGEVSSEGFGVRAEKVLRLAEQLAADLRSQSAEEAAALVERARADAEKTRHEMEQTLIARAAQQDHEAARRQVELNEREQQMASQLSAAREMAEEIRAEAMREAEQLRQEARAHTVELRQEAEGAIRQQRDEADGELRRVRSLRDDVRSEMARLHELLGGEIARPVVGSGAARGRYGAHQAVDEAPDDAAADVDVDADTEGDVDVDAGFDAEVDADAVTADDDDEAGELAPRSDTEEFASPPSEDVPPPRRPRESARIGD